VGLWVGTLVGGVVGEGEFEGLGVEVGAEEGDNVGLIVGLGVTPKACHISNADTTPLNTIMLNRELNSADDEQIRDANQDR